MGFTGGWPKTPGRTNHPSLPDSRAAAFSLQAETPLFLVSAERNHTERKRETEKMLASVRAIQDRQHAIEKRYADLDARHARMRRAQSGVDLARAAPMAGKVQADRSWLLGEQCRTMIMDRAGSSGPGLASPGTHSSSQAAPLYAEVTFPVTGQRWWLRPCEAPRPMDKVMTYGNGSRLPQWDPAETNATLAASQLHMSVTRGSFSPCSCMGRVASEGSLLPHTPDVHLTRMTLRSPATQYQRIAQHRDPITMRRAPAAVDEAEVANVHALADQLPKLGGWDLRCTHNRKL